MTQLAGQLSYDLDLSVDWWLAGRPEGTESLGSDTRTLEISQRGEVLQLLADRATPVAEDSYRWQGELCLWDNEALAGTGPSTRPPGPKALFTSRFTPTEIMLEADGSA